MTPAHVYIHVPFCTRRCSYCDFAIAVRRRVPVDAYLGALEREVALRQPAPVAEVRTIYVGGGTPSTLGAGGVARLLALVTARFRPAAGAEITLEANPDDVDRSAARQWRAAGITRVSLGVQSFDDRVLRWMHRTHDAAAAYRAADALDAAGFSDWSLDLIFALPPLVDRDWEHDLAAAIALAPAHVSCYGLTVEHGTPLARWRARGEVADAPDERWAQEFLLAHERLAAAGFEHYEVSNHARPGRRARHNSAYWMRAPYVGLGPSAHGFDGTTRRWNEREYTSWARRLEAGEDPLAGVDVPTPGQVALEEVYLGLRTSVGVRMEPQDRPQVQEWVRQGWASIDGETLRLTPGGWLRADRLAVALTDARSRL